MPLLGVITAGSPLPGPEEIAAESAETIEVPAELAPPEKLKDVYALRVRGQSMIGALIDDGDIVLLRYQETAENGQMVAARIEDENSVTLKRFYKEGNRVKLQPANSTMEPIYVTPLTSVSRAVWSACCGRCSKHNTIRTDCTDNRHLPWQSGESVLC